MFDDLVLEDIMDDDHSMPIITVEAEDVEGEGVDIPTQMPLIALKNTVLFPGVVIPINVGRTKSVNAVNEAYKSDKWIVVVSQKKINIEDPLYDDLYEIGTAAKILKLLKMPDGSITAIFQGRKRIKLTALTSIDPFLKGQVLPLSHQPIEDEDEFKILIKAIREKAVEVIELSPNIPSEASNMLNSMEDPKFLLNFISSNLTTEVKTKQEILSTNDWQQIARHVLRVIQEEIQLLKVKNQIEHQTRGDIEKQQRDYFLNQQLKMIQQELGQNPQDEELRSLEEKAAKKKWSAEVKTHFEKELSKVKRMNPQVAEYSIMMNYLELLLDLPWMEYTVDNFDLKKVKKVLDKDHFGLEKVKDRIIEHLAVLKLKGDMKSPIICLVGPPGVGKTSLGKSIAGALKRKFVRMSLGGLHDESEIRGHRKTYIGAMPGRVIQAIKKAKSSNPVFILDEIDKMGRDMRGDPSSALLEVLDPEQNTNFYDNYLELEYDLSKVLFIATANSLNSIQPALLDRMEIIELSGYSVEEKIEIAKRHLVPKQLKAHGLKSKDLRLGKKVLEVIISLYTRESGVRALERRIATVMRNIAKKVAMSESYNVTVSKEEVFDILGPTRFSDKAYTRVKVPGVVIGLAWTRVGGDILFIEASKNKGKGKLTLTGNLGNVMKESAMTALSFLKAHADYLGIEEDELLNMDMHIHVPEGAIPKDGPSAGITMLTAISSLVLNKPIKPYLAMTGEITLRGKVLPVGGIKEKILAAKRAGLKEIMLCAENQKHIDEIEPEYIKGLKFIYVETMKQVLDYALSLK